MEYELKANRHIHGCGLGFVPDYYPEEGRWLEPYAFNEGDKITMKVIGSEGDYIVHLLQYTNAGHNAPFVITDGKPRMMPVDANIPVGIMADWSYSLQETTLSPGTILFLYTDGLTEATRSDGELFQEERVQAQLSGHDGNTSAEHLVADMTAAVNRFIGDAEQSDDLTMLVLKMLKGRD